MIFRRLTDTLKLFDSKLYLKQAKRMSKSVYDYDMEVIKDRKSEYPVHPIFTSRTSPYEMTGEDISDKELMTLFEAAKWAPSCYNCQPWRFIYAKRNTDYWQKFLDLLVPQNQAWVEPTAAALVVIVSKKHMLYLKTEHLNPSNSFDSGAAWMSMALEGTARGLVVHGMAGFNSEKAYEVLDISSDRYKVEIMVAIGKQPKPDDRKSEKKISQRNPIKSFVSEGLFVNID